MKKIFLGLAVLSVLFSIVSCQKFDNDKPLTFDVYLDSTTFKVGDPVMFKFKGGDAHQIAFYSGDLGNDYEYRNVNRRDTVERIYFVFQTHNTPVPAVVSGADPNRNNVHPDVFILTDFNDNYNYTDVENANRIELTSFYQWGVQGAWPSMWTPSGGVDITDYVKDKPFHIAFRVKSDAIAATPAPSRSWRTNGHSLVGEMKRGNYEILSDFYGMSWQFVDKNLTQEEFTANNASVISGGIMLLGYYKAGTTRYGQASETWGVSKKFQIRDVIQPAEGSVALKKYVDPPMESHTYYYQTPGKYKAVFIASNASISGSSEVIKEVEFTVTP